MRSISQASGRQFAVSCGHPAATAAALELVREGGNVVDAALAAASALAVLLPQACTLGGDAFILYHDARLARTFALNASGASPAATDFSDVTAVPERGARACTVPGLVGGWAALHGRFGKLAWRRVLSRAHRLAADGFPASAGLASATNANRALLAKDPGAASVFLDGSADREGQLFRQPALATVLDELMSGGAAAFYKGGPAESLSAYLQSRGGWLSAADMAAYEPEWAEPLTTDYRGLTVAVAPPNSFGLFMLLQLGILDRFEPLAGDAVTARRYDLLIDAARIAFAVGDLCVADPRSGVEPVSGLLSGEGREKLLQAFRARKAASPSNRSGTSVISAIDAEGNAVAIVQSVFMVYGSACADPGTGILLNNRMIGFTLEKGHPNCAAPGKRPAHTLNPVITIEDGRVRHVLLSPGGPGQTLTLTQILQAATDHRLPLADAIALPRWSMDLEGRTIVEPDFPAAVFDELNALGHEVGRGVAGSPFFGSAECVERLSDGSLLAVADDRREAAAAAL
jgi:gamma-glutamyltranspeptidase